MFDAERYIRQTILPQIGPAGQAKLAAAKVVVIGTGGLGCPALTYLVSCGVGQVVFVEFDVVALSNLPRQPLYQTDDVGQPKGQIALERLRQLATPHQQVIWENTPFNSQNAFSILKGATVVLDCSDNFGTRYLVNDACEILGIPLVSGSVLGFEGQLTVLHYPPKRVSYRELFPEPPDNVPDCATGGVLAVLPGIIGTLQAQEAIKLILEVGEVLAGRILLYDGLNTTFRTYQIIQNPDYKPVKVLKSQYQTLCLVSNLSISAHDFTQLSQQNQPFTLLDVRTDQERFVINPGGIHIPLDQLEHRYTELLGCESPIIVVCASGMRSYQAAVWLKAQGLQHVFSLEGGLLAFHAF